MSETNHLAAPEPSTRRAAMRPTARTWLKHFGLLLVTFCTVTVAGSLYPFGPIEFFTDANPQTWGETLAFVQSLPVEYFRLVAGALGTLATDARVLAHGLAFSISLLFILTAHEMGHYVACRLYGVDATLPFFIPTPPLIGPAGTFGAFIKIVSPLPSRRATFDIGVAGPLAGFVATLPVIVAGLLTMEQHTPERMAELQSGLYFSDALITQMLAALLGVDLRLGFMNAYSAAAWVGILVTALNLIPSGQLDGGHAVFAVFGARIHYWTGRVAFVVMIALALAGFYFYHSPSGLLFAALLGLMMRVRHPEPLDDTPLDFRRRVVAVVVLAVFILCFTPFPVQVRW